MSWLKFMFPHLFLGLEGAPEGGGAGDPPAQDPPAQDPPAQDPPAAPPVVDPVKAAVAEAIKPLVDKIAILEQTRNVQPPENLPPAINEIDAEIKLREDQLAAIENGTIDKKYQPAIMSKLSEAQARKVGQEMVGQANEKAQFNDKWNGFLRQAYEEYPDLKDPNSELHKEAKAIVESDPSYRKYVESFKPGAKIDFSGIDPRVNLRAAREAAAIVSKRNSGKPLSQNRPGLAKAGLEGGRSATPPAASDELAQLEKKAVESGDPNDWTALLRARDKANAARKQTV